MKFGTDYKTFLLRTAIDAISDVATRYPSVEFFTKRMPISLDMQKELEFSFNEQAYMNIKFFQLRSVDLPDKYEDAIQLTEVTKQDINKAKAERARAKIQQETSIQVATIGIDSTVNQAKGQAESSKLLVNAEMTTFKNLQTKHAAGYAAVKQSLALTNLDLIEYLKGQLIQNYKTGDEKLIVSLPRDVNKAARGQGKA
jgi:regulator of protease activity HflC (stomatin/prohibitin superfamily)